jgi:hypothetical protein
MVLIQGSNFESQRKEREGLAAGGQDQAGAYSNVMLRDGPRHTVQEILRDGPQRSTPRNKR